MGVIGCAGASLGTVTLRKAQELALTADVKIYLEPGRHDGASHLGGKFKLASVLSDTTDVVLVLLFVLGCYWYWIASDKTCAASLRSWAGSILALKLAAPIAACCFLRVCGLGGFAADGLGVAASDAVT